MRFPIAAGILILVFFTFLALRKNPPSRTLTKTGAPTPATTVQPPAALLGELMLAGHGLPGTPPSLDTKILSDFVSEANLSNRHVDTAHFSTNPDLTEILLGKEGKSHPQLPIDHPIIGKNQYGERALLDRWGTPYHVHLVRRTLIEFRSAGPDKTMGNGDDFQWPISRPTSYSPVAVPVPYTR